MNKRSTGMAIASPSKGGVNDFDDKINKKRKRIMKNTLN